MCVYVYIYIYIYTYELHKGAFCWFMNGTVMHDMEHKVYTLLCDYPDCEFQFLSVSAG